MVPKRTIQRWIQVYERKQQVVAKKNPESARKVRTKRFVKKIKTVIEKPDQRKSIRQLARENNCNQRTIARIIYNDLGLKNTLRQ